MLNSFEIVAKEISELIIQDMDEEEFDTFREMIKCYKLDSSDIQDYIIELTSDIDSVQFWDDGSTLEIGSEDILYTSFKNLVMKYLKDAIRY